MSTSERIKTGDAAAGTQDAASAANLLVHPMAGVAAAGAIGLGLASHAFGIWLGTIAGALEVSQRLVGEPEAAQKPQRAKPAALKLVASRPAAKTKPATLAASEGAAVRPRGIDKPAVPDDLKAISGVGPKLAKVLNGLGIWSFAQIAALTGAEIAWLDDHLGFSGRIGRDDWVGQASALSARS